MFRSEEAVKQNLRGEHCGDTPCPTCNKVFRGEEGLKRHLRDKHGGDTPCPTCNKVFRGELGVKQHLRDKHGEGDPEIERGGSEKGAREIHGDKGDDNGKRNVYEEEAVLTRVSMVNHVEHPVYDECVANSKQVTDCRSEEAVKQHLRDMHGGDILCSRCNKMFRSEEGVKQHLRDKHCGDNPCPKCNKVFRGEEGVEQHLSNTTYCGYTDTPCPKCN